MRKVPSKEIVIDGVTYVPKGSGTVEKAVSLKGLKYVIVRSQGAGVFAGYLKSRKGNEAVLLKARRLWYWAGAASLSQLATDGTSDADSCKFPCETEGEHELIGVIEVIPVTKKAQDSINSVKIWQQ